MHIGPGLRRRASKSRAGLVLAGLCALLLGPRPADAMTRLPPIRLSLFPDGSSPGSGGPAAGARLTEADIPGVWRVFDRLAAREVGELSEAELRQCGITAEGGGDASASVILAVDGAVLRTTSSAFAAGSWTFFELPGSPPALEVVLDSKPDAQRLLYRGVVMADGDGAAAGGGAGGARLGRGMPPQVRVYGQVEHLSADVLPQGDGADARLLAEAASSLSGAFSMRKVAAMRRGADPSFVCEVGPTRGLG